MNIEEVEAVPIPNDNTGKKLLEVARLMVKTWPCFVLALQYDTQKFNSQLRSEDQIEKFAKLLTTYVISFRYPCIIRLQCLADGFGGITY